MSKSKTIPLEVTAALVFFAATILIIIFVLMATDTVHGEFNKYTTYTVELGPASMCSTDIDNDGYRDLVTICNGDYQTTNVSSIIYLINNGKGEFTKTVENRTNRPYLLTVADMNGDGNTDMVLLDNVSIKILSNDGTGKFNVSWSYNMSTFLLYSLDVFDLNGDGKNDIAFYDGVQLHLFLANQSTGYTYTKQVLNKTSELRWYDADHDRDTDIFLTYSGMKLFGMPVDSPSIEIYTNNGQGKFNRSFNCTPNFMTGYGDIAKMNGRDVVVVQNYETNAMEIYIWDGSSLNRTENITAKGSFDNIYEIRMEDMDVDGQIELLVLRDVSFKKVIEVYKNIISTRNLVESIEVPDGTTGFCIFDADNNGLKDIGGWEGTHLYMFTGDMVWVALQKGSEDNELPVLLTIKSISENRTIVNMGEQAIITVTVSVADSSNLTYSYSASGGSITGNGSSAIWTAPSTTGNYTIMVTVSDGNLSTTKTITITVEKPKPTDTGKTQSKGFLPGFDAGVLFAVMGVGLLLLHARRRHDG